MNGKRGLFLVFEGGEGSGKTTQAKLLADELVKMGYDVLLTKEPGGDEGICRDIRKVLLNPDYKGGMSARAELLLFEADRAQHVDKVILPALEEGKIVISDRYDAATMAYQCSGRGLNLEVFSQINAFANRGLRPDFVFWIDIDPAAGLQRNKDAKKRDRFEMEDVSFHEKVRAGYRLWYEAPSPVSERFDGSLSIRELQDKIFEKMTELLRERGK